MLKVMISVGEASGDMHGASIAKALKMVCPDASILGMGGNLMRAAGVEIIYDIAELGVFGLLEIVKKLPNLRRIRKLLADTMDRERPDVVVVIDYGGFNIPLAQTAKKKGIPVIYYIPPKVWVWGRSRAKKIAQAVERVAVIFPFEADIYLQAGADVSFVGNPLVDLAKPSLSKTEAFNYFGADNTKPVVLLLPGSRKQEIDNLLPIMLAAAEKIVKKTPECQFFLPVASTISREILQNMLSTSDVQVTITTENTYDLMNIADVAIAASGTVTLEAALIGLPTVIIYKVAPLTYFFAKHIVDIPHFGLPNIVAGRRILPELLQDEVTPENVAQETLNLLAKGERREVILQELAKIKRSLGEGGAADRVANLIQEVAGLHRGGLK